MCTVCGCGASPDDGALDAADERHSEDGQHTHHPGHHHHRRHQDHSHHHHGHDHVVRDPHGQTRAPGLSIAQAVHTDQRPLNAEARASGSARLIAVEQDILSENNRLAASNRLAFTELDVLAVNLMSAPGSGKTTLLARTIEDLRGRTQISVIEGDQDTRVDADRIRASGARAVQINTGKGCHLDARMVARALPELAPRSGSFVFIENVGNLVCPAAFDLGEAARVVLLSVTEGDDKPLKYANMFAVADLLLITKIDLLPYVPFDEERCSSFARRVNPQIEILPVSASSGEGLRLWYDWMERRRSAIRARAHRVAESGR